jgi:hypothetical protein
VPELSSASRAHVSVELDGQQQSFRSAQPSAWITMVCAGRAFIHDRHVVYCYDEGRPFENRRERHSKVKGVITLSTSIIERLLLTIITMLLALGVLAISLADWPIDNFWLNEARESFVRLFSLDVEANVPTWYASAALLLAALLALAIAGHAGTVDRGQWALIGCLLVLMSLDESAVLHEMMIAPLQPLWFAKGLLFYAWIIPGGALALAVALYFLPFAWRLAAPVRLRLLAGGALFVAGALGVESVTGLVEELHGRNRLYMLLTVVEEGFEKVGVFLAISGFLLQLRSLHRIELRVGA